MGTSTRNRGQSGHTPLVPSWLEDDDGFNSVADGETQTSTVIPPIADPDRFRGPRSSFTQYINGGGRNSGSMRKTISTYVRRSLKGSNNATKRLGSARISAGKLYGVLITLSNGGGVQEIEKLLSLDHLEGLPAKQFFIRIAGFICPDGGPNNEGLARSAYFETIADQSLDNKTTEQLTSEECESVLKNYISRVIMENILNDIANKAILLPDDIETVSHIEDAIKQMIKQDVSDAFVEVLANCKGITNEGAQGITDKVYQKTYELLERLSD